MSNEREILSWDGFGEASRDLARSIADSGYDADMILAIARGGLFLAGALGYALSVKNTYTMNVEFYTDVDERLDMPLILPPVPDFVDVSDAKILIVDDEHTILNQMRWGLADEYEVITADNVEDARRLVREHQPGVVTLDVTLGPPSAGPEGLDLLDEIVERDDGAGPLAHPHGLAVADQVDHLADQHLDGGGVLA